MYAPNPYEKGVSTDYFDSENELMSYDFNTNQILEIDDKILQVLQDIGWPVPQNPELHIVNTEIGASGVANINNTYVFSANATGGTLTSCQWEYKIRKIDGSYETKGTSNSSTFTISPFTASSLYDRNSDGYIIGEVLLTGIIDGVECKSTFHLYLECIPGDVAYNIQIEKTSDWVYRATVTLSSSGAESFQVTINDWESGMIITQYFSLPQYMAFKTMYLTYDSPIKFTFKSINQFGQKQLIYNMPPVSYYDTRSAKMGSDAIQVISNPALYELYTVHGVCVQQSKDKSAFFDGSVHPGIYLLKGKDAAGNTILTDKIYISK
jgi:hypothetical protein